MMKQLRLTFGLLMLGLTTVSLTAQDRHKIEVEIAGFTGSEAYLGYYLADKTYLLDTAAVEDGKFVFQGDDPLDKGMYLVVFPPENNYFEVVIDKDQTFSVSTSYPEFVKNMKVKGSKENQVMYDDLHFLDEQRQTAIALQADLEGLEEGSEAHTAISEQLAAISNEVEDYRNNFIAEDPEMLYAKMLTSLKQVDVPESPVDENGEEIDPSFRFRYYRDHFFDYVDFTDDRLLRTPILFDKVKTYFEKLVMKHPDSIIAQIDPIIEKAGDNFEVYQNLVVHFTNQYATSKIMGMDAVYVHMVEQYYMHEEKTPWVDEEQRKKMRDRAYATSKTILGRPAPDFSVKDINGDTQSVHGIEAEYTLLYFWDYDCGHCKTITPKLSEALKDYSEYDIKLMSVNINGDETVWKERVKKYELDQDFMIPTHDAYRTSGFDQLYDIRSTPRLFILDKDKKIVAKQISVESMREILDSMLGIERPAEPESENASEESESAGH
ncbi:thioredoxin-like domain-containing protein [Pontibacter sp. G13]|uniref:thioredoxin-like domain-containing protein n=1 Tax=Pontibacter sp. G13 TaxID=3074898 RepID=UPI00288B5188|nr:thioredoxin-like domain-containing protein [Pontibacter sp. G13]WNJ16623.1 DUF5106 domain-containing protein [Pontibacter sp. G13]